MEDFVAVGKVSDFREGILRVFEVEGEEIGVVYYDGEFHAIGGRCTHERYVFNYTRIRPGDVILCSSHFAFFELRTGRALNMPGIDDLPLYEVRVEGEEVFVSPRRRSPA